MLVYHRVDYWVYHIYYIQTHPNHAMTWPPKLKKIWVPGLAEAPVVGFFKKTLQCHHCRGWEIPETIEVAGKIQLWWTFPPAMVDYRRAMFSSDVFSNVFYCSAMGNSYPNAKILSRNLMSQHNSLLYMDKTWGKLKLLVAATIISGWRLGESEPKPRRITHPTLCLSWPPRSFEAEMMKWFRWTLQFLTNKYQQTLGIWPKLIQSHSNGFKVKGLGPV